MEHHFTYLSLGNSGQAKIRTSDKTDFSSWLPQLVSVHLKNASVGNLLFLTEFKDCSHNGIFFFFSSWDNLNHCLLLFWRTKMIFSKCELLTPSFLKKCHCLCLCWAMSIHFFWIANSSVCRELSCMADFRTPGTYFSRYVSAPLKIPFGQWII